jgi:hypothetical protein
MRDPATRIDPEVEAAIEETRRFLEEWVRNERWNADPPSWSNPHYSDIGKARDEIERSNLSKKTKLLLDRVLVKELKKRGNKPTRGCRDSILWLAAKRLEPRFLLSRNDATTHSESASSIIKQALDRLGVKMREKQIKDIVQKKAAPFPMDLTRAVFEPIFRQFAAKT